MKPATGNSLTEALAKESILSIRLAPDGLSFCASRFGRPLWLHRWEAPDGMSRTDWLDASREDIPQLHFRYPRLRVLNDTDRVCLIPEALYDPALGEEYMRVNDIFPEEEPAMLQVQQKKTITLQTYVAEAFHHALLRHFPEAAVEYTHPLWIGIRRAMKASDTVADISLSRDLLHLVITREGSLQYAETLACQGVGDMLFILGKLRESYDLQAHTLIFSGDRALEMRATAATYYKKIMLDEPIPAKAWKGTDIPRYANLIRAAYENY